jgi:hypothetical protein
LLLNFARALIEHFWVIWALTLVVVAASAMFLSRPHQTHKPVSLRGLLRSAVSFQLHSNLIWLFLFVLLLAFYVFAMFNGEDFAYYDHHIFTDISLEGRNIRLQIRPHQSRFFPLGHQEWNWIQHVTTSPRGYQSFPVFELLVVLLGISVVFRRYPGWLRLLTAFLVLTTPGIAISFFGLIYTERNVILWLVLFMLFFQEYMTARSGLWLLLVLICVQIAIYYKEPVFLIFIGFSLARLVFHLWQEKNLFLPGQLLQFLKRHSIDLGILALSVTFISIFLVINFGRGMSYAEEMDVGSFTALFRYVGANFLLVVFLITIGVRSCYLIFKRKLPDPFWDALALGAVLYFLAYVKLGMFRIYYTAPTDLIAILYLAQLSYSALNRKAVHAVIACVLPLVIVQNAILAFYHVSDRKSVIAGTVQLGTFLKDYASKSTAKNTNLFFPHVSTGWHLQGASSYWSYKGISLRGPETERQQKQNSSHLFTVKSTLPFAENRCVSWDLRYSCFHAASAQSGDLIVVLPGNGLSRKRFNRIAADATPLFCYKPDLPGVQSVYMDTCVFRKK